MKIISWNVNGLRSISKKGFLNWVKKEDPDIICLQEIKTQESQIVPDILPRGYYPFFNFAKKSGYSGVAVFSKIQPTKVSYKLGEERFDSEGRILEISFPKFDLINLYIPHGGRKKENLDYKLSTYRLLEEKLHRQRNQGLAVIGDFNIAHEDIDLARPKQNRKNIMFTEAERQRLGKICALGFTDTFRKFIGGGGHYTWWPYMANARERNIGWRIDYCFVSRKLSPKVDNAFIFGSVPGSDHCPIGVELNI